MKKIKIIDLLNKIANGEIKEGFRVKRPNGIYEYREGSNHFVNIEDAMYIYSLGDFTKLNDEVEIIEKNKKIEEIGSWYEILEQESKKTQLEEINHNFHKIFDRLEQLIDEVNKLKENL